jgi:hypothetical protein
MKKFNCTITSLNLDFQLTNMPDVPIRNLMFHDLGINTRGLYFNEERVQEFQGRHLPPSEPLEKLLSFIERYEDSIESLNMQNFHVNSGKTFLEILSKLKNLKELHINSCIMFDYDPTEKLPENLPKIDSALLTDSSELFFEILKNFKTIRKFKFIKNERNSESFKYVLLDELLAAVPSIKHLILEGSSTRGYLARQLENFPFKLRTIEADGVNLSRNSGEARLKFFKSQVGSLKELRIKNLPHDFDGDEVLKFLIEEMGLEKFYYDGKALIENGRKVDGLKEILFDENTIKAGMELLRQFDGEVFIKKLFVKAF